jgi:hypothetical protein
MFSMYRTVSVLTFQDLLLSLESSGSSKQRHLFINVVFDVVFPNHTSHSFIQAWGIKIPVANTIFPGRMTEKSYWLCFRKRPVTVQ